MISRKEAQELEEQIKLIQQMENIVGNSQYDTDSSQDFKVNIRVDNSVPHSLFKPDPMNKEGWICSEQTFRAMKKDIFALDEQMLELRDELNCSSCEKLVDRQFWHFCPHCGASF